MKKLLMILIALFSVNTFALNVTVTSVTDGDTIRVAVKQLPLPLSKMSVRLSGIDTPELRGSCVAEREKARLATDYLKSYVKVGETLTLRNYKWDKYGGRIDADVIHNGVDLGLVMVSAGYAAKYKGSGLKLNWCGQ